MAGNYFKSYIWLIETIQSRGHITLKELQDLWLRSSVNDEKKRLAPRTFYNHINSIADIFGIEIICDKRDNTYYITNGDELGGNELRNWMLEALSLNSLLNEAAGMKDCIIFENVPSSQRYLTTIIKAIRDKKVINVIYHSYTKPASENLVLEPYCLRQFKRRWYLYAHKGNDESPHLFALDRIQKLEPAQGKFSIPKDFNAHEYFADIYGVRKYSDNMQKKTVLLKASAWQARFFNSLPLHNSQEIVEENQEYTVFRYFLVPDFDFMQDILSFGANVEVLEPADLRKKLGGIINKLHKTYNG